MSNAFAASILKCIQLHITACVSKERQIAPSTNMICFNSFNVYIPRKFNIHLKYKNCKLPCIWLEKMQLE